MVGGRGGLGRYLGRGNRGFYYRIGGGVGPFKGRLIQVSSSFGRMKKV